MEMGSSKFYCVYESILKLYGGARVAKICIELGMANLVSWPKEWRRIKLDGGAKSVSDSGKRELGKRVVRFRMQWLENLQ
jgi:hypothetical protein